LPLALLLLLPWLAVPTPVGAAEPQNPGFEWSLATDAERAQWSAARLAEAEALSRELGTTALMIVHHGRIIAQWGDVTQKVRVASIRKSFLSALYGIAVAEGRIDIALTLADLGIDDLPPSLTEAEKQATIRDLLMARSGVYHEAASEPDTMKARRPERGSHPHGTYWYYNNWDFNTLGAIYQQLTGEDIFAAVEARIARPLGMQDFSAADGIYIKRRVTLYPAYHLNMTARDLARFGLLYLNGGRWSGRQVVPEAWVKESTMPYSRVSYDRHGAYGYMWWVARRDQQRGVKVGRGAFSARGFGGQFILVAPEHDLVVVFLHASHRVTNAEEGVLLSRVMAAAPPASGERR
jgi:CubicO group peptidase (beta-lactamase class C family)